MSPYIPYKAHLPGVHRQERMSYVAFRDHRHSKADEEKAAAARANASRVGFYLGEEQFTSGNYLLKWALPLNEPVMRKPTANPDRPSPSLMKKVGNAMKTLASRIFGKKHLKEEQ